MLAALATVAVGAELGEAQTATPEAVSPALCVVAPLTESKLVEIVAAGTPTLPEELPMEDPEAEIDDASRAEVMATVRESVACANANDVLRAYALFTNRYLQERFGGENQDDLGHLLVALTRDNDVADDADQLTLVSVDELRLLDDGRIAASVTTMNVQTTFIDTLILANVNDRWLIDEVLAGEPPISATPTE